MNIYHPASYVTRYHIVVDDQMQMQQRDEAGGDPPPVEERRSGALPNKKIQLEGHSAEKESGRRRAHCALARRGASRRVATFLRRSLTRTIYVGCPLLSVADFGGRPGAFRGPASLLTAGGSSGTAWRPTRWLPVARLTANTPSSGRCSLNCHPRVYTVAYLVGRVSTSVTAARGHDTRSRHCPHARLPRRRANIAASQALRRPVNRIYSGNAKKTDTKASILLKQRVSGSGVVDIALGPDAGITGGALRGVARAAVLRDGRALTRTTSRVPRMRTERKCDDVQRGGNGQSNQRTMKELDMCVVRSVCFSLTLSAFVFFALFLRKVSGHTMLLTSIYVSISFQVQEVLQISER